MGEYHKKGGVPSLPLLKIGAIGTASCAPKRDIPTLVQFAGLSWMRPLKINLRPLWGQTFREYASTQVPWQTK